MTGCTPGKGGLDYHRIEKDLRARLTDWQGLLQRHVPQARQIMKKFLVGRLVFTPKTDEMGRAYEFTGQGSMGRLLAGLVGAKALVSPTGFEGFWTVTIQGVVRAA